MDSFPQFMEQECASGLLQFWLTAENFYNELSSSQHVPNMEADTSDAIAIYNRLICKSDACFGCWPGATTTEIAHVTCRPDPNQAVLNTCMWLVSLV